MDLKSGIFGNEKRSCLRAVGVHSSVLSRERRERVLEELGTSMGPLRSKGSSVGEAGGAGWVRSISGISVLTVNTPVTLFRDFPDSGLGVALLVRDILGLELARRD